MFRWLSIAWLLLSACAGDGAAIVSLADGLFFPTDLAVDDEHVYWVQYDGSVHRVAKLGGTPEQLAPPLRERRPGTIPIEPGTYDIAVDGDRLVWSESVGGGARLWTLIDGVPEILIEEDGYIHDVAASADRVLWLSDSRLQTLDSDGEVEVIAGGLAHPRALVAGDDAVVWVEAGVDPGETASGRLARAPLAGGEVEVLAENLHDPRDVIRFGDEIIWTDDGSCTRTGNLCSPNGDAAVRRAAVDAPSSVREVAGGFTRVAGLSGDGGELYFTGDGRIWAVQDGSREVREIAGGSFDETLFPGAVLADSSGVYWVNGGDNSGANGSIVRADRP